MKRILLLISVLFSVSGFSQTVTSSCTGADSIIKKYLGAANQLAVRHVYHTNSTYQDSISLDKALRDRYLRALIVVYNATALPARDTVVGTYNIKPYNPIVDNVLVQADSNLQWMKNLRANIIPTGYGTIDSLISKYYLKKIYYSTWITPNANVVLKTDTNCNTKKLAEFIGDLSGVASAQEDYLFGDGNDIEDSLTTNFTWLVYSHGWGDCPNGCYYKRYWQFRIYNDCSVEYGGSWGAPLTVGMKENEKPEIFLKLFPNPTSNIVTISTGIQGEKHVSLLDATGQQIVNEQKTEEQFSLDMSAYANGIYFLYVRTGAGLITRKIVKE